MSQLVLYSVQDIAARTGVDATLIEQLVELGVINAHPGAPTRVFACEVTIRVSKFVRLQRDLGLNQEGAALVIDLLDRIEILESRLRHYEGR